MNSAAAVSPTRRVRLRRWLGRVLVGLLVSVAALALVGCAYQALATAAGRRAHPAPGQLVPVGAGGERLHLLCAGEGGPTVLLENGLGGATPGWAYVQPAVAQVTRVCAYDRAGLGWSDPAPRGQPRDAAHLTVELHALLAAAGERGPYVLAAWSYGGLYARAFTGAYPAEVAGLALLDASHPEQWTASESGQAAYQAFAVQYKLVPFLARLGLLRLMSAAQPRASLPAAQAEQLAVVSNTTSAWDSQSAEFLASPATGAQVLAAGDLGDRPLLVVTATDHGTPPAEEERWQAWQVELAGLSTNSRQVILEGATHADLWLDEATAAQSAAAIVAVVEAVRTGGDVDR